jgi:hypothetical protein
MSNLLRLYPAAWRERYGDELVALLEDHPATLLDHLDLMRGALDAHLHPQIRGVAAVPDKELPVNQRAFGFVAAAGGIIWILGILSIFVLPRDAEGSRSLGLAMVGMALAIAFIGAALGDLGTRRASATSERTGRLVIVVSLALGLTLVVAWPIFLFGLFGFPILVALLAIRGTRNGVFPTWFAVVASIAGLGVLGGIGVDMQAGHDETLVLIAVVGLPALLLAWLALRGPSLARTPSVSPTPPRADPA